MRNELPRGPDARWFFEGSKGQAFTILAESYEFDVYLLLIDPRGRQVASGNRNGELVSARIATVLGEGGRYTVVVCGSSADQFGTYWLSLESGLHEVDWSLLAAKARYEGGMSWGARMGSSRALSWMNLELGRFFARHNQWDEADKYYQMSLSISEQGRNTICGWSAALERGRLFGRRRRYEQAVGQLQRALALSKDLRSPREGEAITLVELGNLSPSSGRSNVTRSSYYRTAMANAEEYALPSTRVALYTALSDVLQAQDREKSFYYAEQAFAIHDGLDPALDLEATGAVAGAYLFLKPERSEEGLRLVGQMRERARQVGCVDEEVAALILMSMAKETRHEIADMIEMASEALALTSPEDENPNPRRVILQLLADGEIARENFQAALSWCSKALQTVESAWARESVEEAQRELLSQARAICTQIIGILDELNSRSPNSEYARRAFDYAERSRSRALLEQLFGGNAKSKMMVDPLALRRDDELIERLSEVRGKIALLHSSGYPSREQLYHLQEERANLIAERLRLRAEIGESLGSSYGAAHLSPRDSDQAQKELSTRYPHSAILYYQLGVRKSVLIILTPKECAFMKLPDWRAISKAVEEWRAAVLNLQTSATASHFEAYVEVARRLYNMLIRPAETLITGRQLIIVPSDVLCRLAFEALVVDKANAAPATSTPEYLIQRNAVSYVPSVSVLAEIESRFERRPPANRMLLLGDASSDTDGSGLSREGISVTTRSGLQPLPAAREEVLRIAELAANHGIRPTVWLGPEASKAKVKSVDLSAFGLIHIATHGISDYQDGEVSALSLSSDPKQNQAAVLTSDEVSKLRLDADLVVLSGCETSVGEEAGAEGIVGFNRNFLIAGARCVCGSLWQVEDSWTEKLMTAFYRAFIVKRYNKSSAMRSAKLAMVKQGANPSQWAPFVLVGSYR